MKLGQQAAGARPTPPCPPARPLQRPAALTGTALAVRRILRWPSRLSFTAVEAPFTMHTVAAMVAGSRFRCDGK